MCAERGKTAIMVAKPKRAGGIDLGSQSVKAVELIVSGGQPAVSRAVKVALDPLQMNSDPMATQVAALRSITAAFEPGGTVFVAALSGQSVVIRYPRLPFFRCAAVDDEVLIDHVGEA